VQGVVAGQSRVVATWVTAPHPRTSSQAGKGVPGRPSLELGVEVRPRGLQTMLRPTHAVIPMKDGLTALGFLIQGPFCFPSESGLGRWSRA
jgi:hypothetical protein